MLTQSLGGRRGARRASAPPYIASESDSTVDFAGPTIFGRTSPRDLALGARRSDSGERHVVLHKLVRNRATKEIERFLVSLAIERGWRHLNRKDAAWRESLLDLFPKISGSLQIFKSSI